jgi:hypothetical protein
MPQVKAEMEKVAVQMENQLDAAAQAISDSIDYAKNSAREYREEKEKEWAERKERWANYFSFLK